MKGAMISTFQDSIIWLVLLSNYQITYQTRNVIYTNKVRIYRLCDSWSKNKLQKIKFCYIYKVINKSKSKTWCLSKNNIFKKSDMAIKQNYEHLFLDQNHIFF